MSHYDINLAMPGYVGPADQPLPPGDPRAALKTQVERLVEQERRKEAIDLLEEAVDQYPKWKALHRALAQLYLDEKRIPDAQRQMLILEELGCQQPEFLVSLGAVHMSRREYGEAIVSFRHAKAMGAPAGEWEQLLGESLHRTGRLEEADRVYLAVLDTAKQQRSRLLCGLAAIRLQQQRYEEAVQFCLQALKERPVKSRALYFLGLAGVRMGNHEGAVRAFERFAEKQKHRVAPYRWLERYAREAGNDDEADRYNLRAREILENRRLLQLEKQRLKAAEH